MSLRVNEITKPSRFNDIKEDWDRILTTSGEDEVFLRTEWIWTWWKFFGEGRKMILLEITDGSAVVGYAPLMISKVSKLPPWKTVEFIASDASDRSAIISENGRTDVHQCAWEYVHQLKDWDGISIRNMRKGSPTAEYALIKFKGSHVLREVSPYIPIMPSYDKFLENLERKNRHTLSRCWRRLKEDHVFEFGVTKDRDAIREYMDSFISLMKARWNMRHETSVIEIPGMIEFIKSAFEALAERGWASVHHLEEKGEPFAVGLGFEYNKRYSCYLSAFDPQYANYSPGTLLLDCVIKMCHERGLLEVDLLRGAEPYKYRLGAIDRELIGINKERERVIKGMLKKAKEKLQ
ncbi:MAG: GNAT family N-acetyltransferase [Methanomassiliicoccales archaeon]|jgi:CelD/BcsL family acetyltransferase involved in cellulose biosynthesis|nr:GNAT family N-acetyltransferase [Methanomassiliicoccales archaeon]